MQEALSLKKKKWGKNANAADANVKQTDSRSLVQLLELPKLVVWQSVLAAIQSLDYQLHLLNGAVAKPILEVYTWKFLHITPTKYLKIVLNIKCFYLQFKTFWERKEGNNRNHNISSDFQLRF